MKNRLFHPVFLLSWKKKSSLKGILYMKLSVIMLLATCFQVSAKGYSQMLTLHLKDASIGRALSEIGQKVNYRFFYSDDLIPINTKVNLKAKNEQLTDVLKELFAGTSLNYKILDNRVIVILKDAKNKIKNISGKVVDEKGNPMPGVSILVKDNNKGTFTDNNGAFSIEVPDNTVLVFSYIGYKSQEINIKDKSEIDVTMELAEGSKLNDIVVTALGIKQTSNKLSYNVQTVNSDELNNVKTDNLMNSLSGKVAGLTISPSASGVGGSAKVILRGSRSANGNNQPLYVIDGVPISNSGNSNGQQNTLFGGGPDGGDGISNLNPEDIASISILEGASAAALYGSQAQNGVILITTKKGKEGKAVINFTSSFSNDQIAYKPALQKKYGATTAGSTDSWGSPVSGGHDNLNDFFQNGTNLTNAINLSAGSQNAQTYFSYANTNARGVEPGNKLQRNNFNLRETGHFLNNKLTVDGNVMFVNQKINNSPAIGFYFNPLVSLYLFPPGKDILPYKNQYEFPDSVGSARQNWPIKGDDLHQHNPWWIINRITNVSTRNRIILSGSVKYDFSNWLNIQVRGNVDRTSDDYEMDRYSGTDQTFNSNGHGYMTMSTQTFTQKYGDAILSINDPKTTSKFQVGGLIGTSITDAQTKGLTLSGDLSTVNFFTPGNIIAALANTTSNTLSNAVAVIPNHSQLQSLFANANLSYSDWAFLSLTGRNDWSSNLSFTPNDSYFYPSAGLSVVLSQLTHMPKAISYAKVRATYAQVGNTVPPYLTKVQNTQNAGGQLQFNTASAFSTLKPEKTNSFELGTDWRLMNDKINFSFTYYKTNTLNQYVPVQPVVASLVSTGYVNAGNIQNTGIEFTLGANIIKNANFSWNTSFNGSFNKNKIIDVDSRDSISQFVLTSDGNSYESMLVKGGSYGDIYGYTFARDNQGRIIFSGSGTANDPYKPTHNANFGLIGNPNPKFQLGWNNDLSYKDFSFSFLIDGKFGGHVLSMTQAILDQYGVSEVSAQARDAGGVKVNGVAGTNAVSTVGAQAWYNSIGGRGGISEAYMYSATVVRLREASFGYNFPISHSVVTNIKLSIIGRNLLYLYKKAPFDPELTMSTGNGMSGVDMFNQPATRFIGANLNVTF